MGCVGREIDDLDSVRYQKVLLGQGTDLQV